METILPDGSGVINTFRLTSTGGRFYWGTRFRGNLTAAPTRGTPSPMARGPRLGALGTLHPVQGRDLARQGILRDDADRDRCVARVVRRDASAHQVGRPGLSRDIALFAPGPPLQTQVARGSLPCRRRVSRPAGQGWMREDPAWKKQQESNNKQPQPSAPRAIATQSGPQAYDPPSQSRDFKGTLRPPLFLSTLRDRPHGCRRLPRGRFRSLPIRPTGRSSTPHRPCDRRRGG